MTQPNDKSERTGRRQFLSQLSTAAAGSAVVLASASQADDTMTTAPALLPTIQLGPHRVTRLVAGWNPIAGYSYLGPNLNQHMQEYFTPEHIVEYLDRCESAGINTHQFSRPETMSDVFRTLRERGSRMKYICLHAGGAGRVSIKKVVELTDPIAIVHHGGVTDRLFREGKKGEVLDFVKQVRDAGLLAGVSAHNPDCIKRVADEGWPVDLFMTCFYHITRTDEEVAKMPPVVTVQMGKPFFASDPEAMTEVVRQVDQPCLGFKILAAGRKCYSKPSVKEAFQFAFEHIKPADGVIVGMYPRFYDEIRDNAQYTRQFASALVA
ncbi:MAG: aldo-keto reductase family protein [Planctomycetota bacterium]|jgi:hypothetical protein